MCLGHCDEVLLQRLLSGSFRCLVRGPCKLESFVGLLCTAGLVLTRQDGKLFVASKSVIVAMSLAFSFTACM